MEVIAAKDLQIGPFSIPAGTKGRGTKELDVVHVEFYLPSGPFRTTVSHDEITEAA